MSCAHIALDRAGIPVTNYYASEIDKYAIKVAQKNYPDTIQLGDICNIKADDLPQIDLLIGGSPCQGFSFAGKQLNFEDVRSKLFFEFVRLLKECKPKYFLLENVRMKQEYQDVISELVGVKPIMINSSLLSAQNRVRLYWTNIPVEQPADKGIVLSDMLQDDADIKTYLSKKHYDAINKNYKWKEISKDGKSNTLLASYHKRPPYGPYVLIVPEATKKGYAEIQEGDCYDATFPNSKTRRGRSMKDKCNCLTATKYDYRRYTPTESEPSKYRMLTPKECSRLQTVPDSYLEDCGVSNSQKYKMLGNGFTVDVIAHILGGIK